MSPAAHEDKHGVRDNLNKDRKIKWRKLYQLEIQYEMLLDGAWPLGLHFWQNGET